MGKEWLGNKWLFPALGEKSAPHKAHIQIPDTVILSMNLNTAPITVLAQHLPTMVPTLIVFWHLHHSDARSSSTAVSSSAGITPTAMAASRCGACTPRWFFLPSSFSPFFSVFRQVVGGKLAAYTKYDPPRSFSAAPASRVSERVYSTPVSEYRHACCRVPRPSSSFQFHLLALQALSSELRRSGHRRRRKVR